jgi:hypothetical protein
MYKKETFLGQSCARQTGVNGSQALKTETLPRAVCIRATRCLLEKVAQQPPQLAQNDTQSIFCRIELRKNVAEKFEMIIYVVVFK